MARPGTTVSLFIPEDLFSQIEEFRYDQKIPSRVEAIRILLRRGLPKKKEPK